MSFPKQDCNCRRCESERDALRAPWLRIKSTLKYVCSDCGQERCPRAYSHERACTGQAGRVES